MTAQWSNVAVELLLAIMKEKEIVEQLSSNKRNETIYKGIVEEFKEYGQDYSVKQVRSKVKALKVLWKSVRDNNNTSGKNHITCKYFTEMDELWGHGPMAEPYYHMSNFELENVNKLHGNQLHNDQHAEHFNNESNDSKNLENNSNGVDESEKAVELFKTINTAQSQELDIELNEDDITNQSIEKPKEYLLKREFQKANDDKDEKQSKYTASKRTTCQDGEPKDNFQASTFRDTVSKTSCIGCLRIKKTKTENVITQVLKQFREDSLEQQNHFIAMVKKTQEEFLDKMLKFEEEQTKRNRDHELKIISLLMKSQNKSD